MSRPVLLGPLFSALPLLLLLAFCVPGITAFGAGNIPSFAYLEGKAFRHGDIEDILEELLKKGAGGAAGGFAISSLLSKGTKFKSLDIKRVYFGNWLRDYSQAVDVAGLKKLPLQTIINLCMVLGFLAHGYATAEFEVTPERLGVYLPTEHIDNPKGYADGEDARKYDPRLRGPVDPRELEIDPRTGMKNYIANENGTWDTSRALVRRTLERCIHHGRLYSSQGRKEDEYEAFRLLGQALHTLEDFPAHSNFCELALVSMGHHQVFVHVGDHLRVRTPHGRSVAPLVTGTFGGSDFVHSLLGEATDHISQASVSDLSKELSNARAKSADGTSAVLRQLLTSIPGSSGSDLSRDVDRMDQIRASPAGGGKRPEEMSPQELHAVLWQVLSFRDSMMKKVTNIIERIPGLASLLDKVSDSVSVFIYTTLEPYLKPLLQTASTTLATSSAEVINNKDQFEVFHNPTASDPTHSFLSKDHFNLILNEPAGNIAKLIVVHTVKLVVKAWSDPSVNVHGVTEDVLSCLFHPDFHNPASQIQREMMQYMRTWLDGHGHQKEQVLSRLTKDAVRNHRNIRTYGDNEGTTYVGGVGHDAGINAQNKISGYLNQIPAIEQTTSMLNTLSIGRSGPESTRRETITTSTVTSRGQSIPPSGPPPPMTGTTYVPPYTGIGEAASYYSGSTTKTSVSESAVSGQRQGYSYQPQERFSAPSGPPPPPLGEPREGSSHYAPERTLMKEGPGGNRDIQHHHHQERYPLPSGPPPGTDSSYHSSERRIAVESLDAPTNQQPRRHYQYSSVGNEGFPQAAPLSGSQQFQAAPAFPSPHNNLDPEPASGPGSNYAPHYLPPPGPPPSAFSPPSFPAPDGPPPGFVGVPFNPPGGPPPYPPPGGFGDNTRGFRGSDTWR